MLGWLILAALGLLAIAGKSAGARSGGGNVYDHQYPTAVWAATVGYKAMAAGKPRGYVPFANKWMDLESGGAPCAIGEPGKTGPDGLPREIGIAQVYNPDNFKLPGMPPARNLRAYCSGNSGMRTRMLTQAEMDEQVQSLFVLIDYCAGETGHWLASTGTGWLPGNGPDYWRMVKAWHAYPPIVHQGLPAVVKKLGFPPRTWQEFRTTLGMDDPSVRSKVLNNEKLTEVEKLKWTWMRGLDNAEECGGAVTQEALS